MIVNFSEALATLGGNDAVVRIANAARPPADYLGATFLPEQNRPGYVAKSGSMTIRSTMAGIVGMDSPYPSTGLAESSTFMEKVAKLANDVTIPEEQMREMQQFAQQMLATGSATREFVLSNLLNFLQKVVLQPHLDRMEWLRWQALATGEIDWTFNQKEVAVDYGIPSAHKFATRTSTAGYGGTASAFWSDVRAAQKLLRYGQMSIVMHPDTLNVVLSNEANAVEVVSQNDTRFEIRRLVTRGGNTVASSDARERIAIVAYGAEGEVFDPANPGKTIKIPFVPAGAVAFIGRGGSQGFVVGQGATEPAATGLELGYTHIAPTVEGGGVSGRWARVDVPNDRPWQVRGQAVTNGLPVIENPEKLVIASTVLP